MSDDLRSKLEMLRELGLLDRVHSIDGLVLFPAAAARPALSKSETAELEARRAKLAEDAANGRTFGAAGGMMPNRANAAQHQKDEERVRAREAREIQRIRAARAELDAKKGDAA